MSTAETTNYLEMSDEELLNVAAPEPVADPVEATSEEVQPEAEEAVAEATPQTDDEDKEENEDKNDGAEAAKEDDAPAEQAERKSDDEAVEAPEVKKEEVKPESTEIDYKAAYEKLLTPFKANGREIKVESVDDAVALMQMGANYNKKMAALKPNLKLMKLLEQNNLLSEERISFLIELDKKNPDAINKLVQDSGISPMDFDAEKAGEYKPKIHSVDDREIALDTVLEEIQESPGYARTLEIVSQRWDGASKQVIANAPQLLKVINDHVDRGIYDLVSAEVERERVFGRLTGLSDIEAYRQVGDAIQARGGFNHLAQAAPAAPAVPNPPMKPVVVPPKPKPADDPKLIEKRRAASPTRSSAAPSVNPNFNPLNLSDEEFNKLAAPRYG